MKIAVGMSGGVDSAVAAHLLHQQGHEVVGIMMTLWDGPPRENKGGCSSGACYGPDEETDIADARRIAESIGIPLITYDCLAEYRKVVLHYFREEYRAGRTPNPCIVCNQRMKFGLLPSVAKEKGIAFDAFATGHYARIRKDPATGHVALLRATERRQDQSYFIHRLSTEQLSSTLFPLGEMSKAEVRQIALHAALPVSEKPDSQDFYEGDHRELLDFGDWAGPILHTTGKLLGSHSGHWNYTIGQRKGLGLSSPQPLYVVAIDAEENSVIVGEIDDLGSIALQTENFHLLHPELPERATVKVRSRSQEVACTLLRSGKGVRALFDTPMIGVAPGQSAVFYLGDRVVGGGVIERSFAATTENVFESTQQECSTPRHR